MHCEQIEKFRFQLYRLFTTKKEKKNRNRKSEKNDEKNQMGDKKPNYSDDIATMYETYIYSIVCTIIIFTCMCFTSVADLFFPKSKNERYNFFYMYIE